MLKSQFATPCFLLASCLGQLHAIDSYASDVTPLASTNNRKRLLQTKAGKASKRGDGGPLHFCTRNEETDSIYECAVDSFARLDQQVSDELIALCAAQSSVVLRRSFADGSHKRFDICPALLKYFETGVELDTGMGTIYVLHNNDGTCALVGESLRQSQGEQCDTTEDCGVGLVCCSVSHQCKADLYQNETEGGEETLIPSTSPSRSPSSSSSSSSTSAPTVGPSRKPSISPSNAPSIAPSSTPSASPTSSPSSRPIALPCCSPIASPTHYPTATPSETPSTRPTFSPSTSPSQGPSSVTNIPIPVTCERNEDCDACSICNASKMCVPPSNGCLCDSNCPSDKPKCYEVVGTVGQCGCDSNEQCNTGIGETCDLSCVIADSPPFCSTPEARDGDCESINGSGYMCPPGGTMCIRPARPTPPPTSRPRFGILFN
ncbi:hypothetical protein HJC23_004093 [Cyclotella cryptica]|uniref:Circumsporozoite protein n=1 Tax=Cyclotella cryptica TaxID=29204 RepID=A0ABD3P382_9STRA|eukprot:CCRYP_018227-RA/>CCRYP_018227-RA protein AED:0.10 eAED:0.10 QI:0/-1/0/1/-1/1/1/0/432